jgi:hypothetical protein
MKQISITVGSICMMLWISLGMASAGSAAQCHDLSPTIKAGRKFTEPNAGKALTGMQYQQIKALFESLEGDWVGDATQITCDSADSEDQEIDAFTIDAEAKMDRSGEFLLRGEFYSAKEHTHQQEALRLYLNERYLRINYDSGIGDLDLIDLSEDKIDLRYLIRVQNRGNAGGIYNEYFYRIEKSPSGFTVHQDIYTQGRLSAKYDWRFRRN